MGRFVYSMNVSLDLRIEQDPRDDAAGEWLRIGEELHRAFNAHAQALAALRAGTDGAIGVGGAALATQLLRAASRSAAALYPPGNPRRRQPLFDDYDVPVELDLLEQRSFEHGVTMHRYTIRNAKETSPC